MTMTNRQLLEATNDRLLTSIESQRRYILRLHSVAMPCPNCGTKQDVFQAAGLDVDDYDSASWLGQKYHCVSCKRELKHTVPIISAGGPGWHWSLVPIAA